MTKRRRFTDQFKAKVALEALRGDKTIQEIAAKHGLHPNQVSTFKQGAVEGLHEVFAKSGKGKASGSAAADEKERDQLHATIGRLKVENDFLSKGLGL